MTMAFDTLNTDELSIVEELDLSYQNLEEIPVKQLKDNPDVIFLELACNRIRTLDTSLLEYLHNIIHLDLSNNQLSCLPENFGCLTKLRHLDISFNEIKCLPVSFSKLKNLVWLKISGNPLMPILKAIAKRETWDSDEYYSCARNIVVFMQQVDDSQSSIAIDNSQIVSTKRTQQVNTDIEVLFNRAKPPLEKRNPAQTNNNEAMLVEDKSGNYFYVSLGKKINHLAPYAKSFENLSKEDKSPDLEEDKPTISTFIKFLFKGAIRMVGTFSFMMLLLIFFFSLTYHPQRFQDLLQMIMYPSTEWFFFDYLQKIHSYLFNKFSSISSVFPVATPLPPPIRSTWGLIVQSLSDLYYSWFKNWHYKERDSY